MFRDSFIGLFSSGISLTGLFFLTGATVGLALGDAALGAAIGLGTQALLCTTALALNYGRL